MAPPPPLHVPPARARHNYKRRRRIKLERHTSTETEAGDRAANNYSLNQSRSSTRPLPIVLFCSRRPSATRRQRTTTRIGLNPNGPFAVCDPKSGASDPPSPILNFEWPLASQLKTLARKGEVLWLHGWPARRFKFDLEQFHRNCSCQLIVWRKVAAFRHPSARTNVDKLSLRGPPLEGCQSTSKLSCHSRGPSCWPLVHTTGELAAL